MAKPCGYCGIDLAAGTPVLAFIHGSRQMLRCGQCAGEPEGELVLDTPETPTLGPRLAERIDAIRGRADDFKHKQAGDR